MPDEFFDADELGEIFADRMANMPGSAATDPIENTDVAATRFLKFLLDAGCFEKKMVPYSEPVFRFKPDRYNNYRNEYLKKSKIHVESSDFPKYYNRVFEGYLSRREELGEPDRGEVISRDQIAKIDWSSASNRLRGKETAQIKTRIGELATTIEQADLPERHRANLLARVHAVSQLLEAPDPAWKEVLEIMNNPYLTVFLNAYAIIQIITGIL